MKNHTINVSGTEIIILKTEHEDYISLTDMAKYRSNNKTGIIISNWLSKKYTLQFIGGWEKLHNPLFNVIEFDNIKNEAGTNAFIVSTSAWIKSTNAIGIKSSAGRYGGTFAHKDIAFEFATWLSPEFKLYLIKEFQRLKEEENERLSLGWDIKRNLAKINYRIHTDAIKECLIPLHLSEDQINVTYATEADVLNKALFGLTAREWRIVHPKQEGNMRDYATMSQLVCLANLESLNAVFIRQGLSQKQRLIQLNEVAIVQMRSLVGNPAIKKLK